MRRLVVLLLGLVAVSAYPRSQRIVGGSLTTIDRYPDMVALLYSSGNTGHTHMCGGTIINNRSILTAAHCTHEDPNFRWRSRLGSTFSNRGGVLYNTHMIINHPQYDAFTFNNDIAIIRTSTEIIFTNIITPGRFAGHTYHVSDNAVVWTAGWGFITQTGPQSEQLRHVQIWTVNQGVCNQRYSGRIRNGMLCAGWLDVGGRDACTTDSGGPLYHQRVVVGVVSFGAGCGLPRFPGVYARVQYYARWIESHR